MIKTPDREARLTAAGGRGEEPRGKSNLAGALRLALALSVSALALPGCSQDDAQITAVADSFRRQIDEKDKELATLRASEGTLRTQMGELQGRVLAMQGEMESLRAKPIDVAALARELAPHLATQTPAPAPAVEPPPPETSITPAPAERGPTRATSSKSTRSKDPGGRTSGGPPSAAERKRIEMNWDVTQPQPR